MKHKILINKMTLYEKISLLTGANFWTSREIERLGIPSLCFTDGPSGVRKQATKSDHLGLNPGVPATCFPAAAAIANSWDEALVEETGEALGREAAALNVDVVLGPGLNIKRSPLCGRNFEYYSEDPYLSGKMAAAFTRGIQKNGISACLKHFAANNQELRRMTTDSIIDERTLREIYLTGFEIAVKEGKPYCIMSSYNKLNGIYTNEDSRLLRDILRAEWGFEGFIVTDWGGGNDPVQGVIAGCNLEMPSVSHNSNRELLEAVRDHRLDESIIDKSIDELLNVIFNLKNSNYIKTLKNFDINENHNIARKAASESIVLLKNEDNILPLKKGKKIAIIGGFAENPRYQGAGSSIVNPSKLENILDCICEYDLHVTGYEQGFNRQGKKDEARMKNACVLAKKSDLILLFLGMDETLEVEGQDRTDMKLKQNQIELLEALSKINSAIVVILSCGAPVEMQWLDNCKAVVHGYLGGQAGSRAILDILTGKICPSGKLAESYPVVLEDTPCYNYFPGNEKTAEYREGIYTGYRYYDTANIKVQFPFGFGLSYTTFQYSDINAGVSGVSFNVTNTGKVFGAEICQVYIGKKNSNIFRPKKELKGFVKIKLAPLQCENVFVKFDDKAFRYYDIENGEFMTEPGIYEIYVGSSSLDIRLSAAVSIKGENKNKLSNKNILPSYYSGNIKNVQDSEYKTLLNCEIPESKWDRSAPLGINDTLSQMFYPRGWIARLIYKILTGKINNVKKSGKPDMNVLFLLNMPFRSIAKMTNGAFDIHMTEALLYIVNGHFFKGIFKLAVSWNKKRKANRQFAVNLHNYLLEQ